MTVPATEYWYNAGVGGVDSQYFTYPDYIADSGGVTYFTSALKVEVNGVLKTLTTDYTIYGAYVKMNSPLATGSMVHIYRETQGTSLLVTTPSVTALRATHLDKNFWQLFWLVQEAYNYAKSVFTKVYNTVTGRIEVDLNGAVLTDAGTTLYPTDLVTKAYVDALLTNFIASTGSYVISQGYMTVTPGDTLVTLPLAFKFGILVLQGIPQAPVKDYSHTIATATVTFTEEIRSGCDTLYYILFNDPT